MNVSLPAGTLTGSVRIPASKSQAHRLLICAALGESPVTLRCDGISRDIDATARCLQALGAKVTVDGSAIRLTPGRTERPAALPCGESGSTLRFLLPVAAAMGVEATFHREGRLPQRPLHPLDEELTRHGVTLSRCGDTLTVSGQLQSGSYTLPGNVSSQYISGLLMALPLLHGDSTLTVTEPVESAAYIAMTEDALRLSGIAFTKDGWVYRIPGGQTAHLPADLSVEGDWSNAAFFLCAGALSETGVTVTGLNAASSQGDRAVVEILRQFGAKVTETADSVTVSAQKLHGITIDAAPIPDLIPTLSVVAACAEGETRIVNAARLRLKESDRIATTAALLRAVGGSVAELPDGLTIHGAALCGGTVDGCNDHRIAMAAAVAASVCPVTVLGSQCVQKSYPRFWEDYAALKGDAL